VSVTVNLLETNKMLDRMAQVVEGKREVMRMGARIMQSETDRAFAQRVDPSTGRPWPSRKHSYPWPLLHHTGQLQRILTTGWGVRTKSGRPRLFGKVREGFARGTYSRGGGGEAYQAEKPFILVAGAVHFGRRGARSASGWKPNRRGKLYFHGGGTKLSGTAASTGPTPPRPLFGMGRSARRQFARAWRRAIRKAAG